MKTLLLPRICRIIGVVIWAGAILLGMGLIYDWVHTTPEWANVMLLTKFQKADFEFPTWSRLIYDRVQTTSPNGELIWYGGTTAYHFNALITFAICIGAALIFFSKQRVEDEMSQQERLRSLAIALGIDIVLFILSYVSAFLPSGAPTFLVQIAANNFAIFMILLPAVYLTRQWILSRSCNKEEIIL